MKKQNMILEGLQKTKTLRVLNESAQDIDGMIDRVNGIYSLDKFKKPVNLESDLNFVSQSYKEAEDLIVRTQNEYDYQKRTALIKRAYNLLSKASNLMDGVAQTSVDMCCIQGIGNKVDTGDQDMGYTLGRDSNSNMPMVDMGAMGGMSGEEEACNILCNLRDLIKNITKNLALQM